MEELVSESLLNVPNGTPCLSIEDIVIVEENQKWKVSAQYKCNPTNSVEELGGKISVLLDILLPMTPDQLHAHLRAVVAKQIEQAWLKAEAVQKKS
ncbi:hypothetical protein [Komagataeibacter sp. FNDCR2]|uniref:hypothetical protein n=1 Tax=Komagataeibacter sp. FNDCR2 TaxID=2878682 RepID=UPI001E6559C3|nr:hypothetical protein [Komagataeibacter sp. FNDCR2]MCE2575270.1 hypothetical protein [Komagataeibacter sp. FNDCR2]